jgi:hypothetical protein
MVVSSFGDQTVAGRMAGFVDHVCDHMSPALNLT